MKFIKHVLKTFSCMILFLILFLTITFISIFCSQFIADLFLEKNIINSSSHFLTYISSLFFITMFLISMTVSFLTYRK